MSINDFCATSTIAYLVVVHGSRDPLYASTLHDLLQKCRQGLPPKALLAAAWLEISETDLSSQVSVFARQAAAQGCTSIKVLPLFLAPGVHANEDVPAAIARAELPLHLTLTLLEPIGNHMSMVLAQIRQSLPPATILLVHGSRSTAPFLPELAGEINAQLAYWAIPTAQASSFADSAWALSNQGEVGILLYFLFPGKITTSIAEHLNELRSRFPQVKWQATPPLALGDQLVTKILELLLT